MISSYHENGLLAVSNDAPPEFQERQDLLQLRRRKLDHALDGARLGTNGGLAGFDDTLRYMICPTFGWSRSTRFLA